MPLKCSAPPDLHTPWWRWIPRWLQTFVDLPRLNFAAEFLDPADKLVISPCYLSSHNANCLRPANCRQFNDGPWSIVGGCHNLSICAWLSCASVNEANEASREKRAYLMSNTHLNRRNTRPGGRFSCRKDACKFLLALNAIETIWQAWAFPIQLEIRINMAI